MLAAAVAFGAAAENASVARFSSMAPGPLQKPWRMLSLAKVPAADLALVAEEGAVVLRSRSAAASGTAAHALDVNPSGLRLSWRWKIDRVVEKADLARKDGDDFAARVYVFYDFPRRELSLAERAKLAVAELFYGERIPTAAICYVWDNRHPPGTSRWNPYSGRVRTVVLRSGSPGAWQEERRDLEADFRAAFERSDVPRVTGIGAGNDTDQTGETVTAWFGDFLLERRR
jgi:hypothetical protein